MGGFVPCTAAANEVITYEDFSISFSVATLSDEGWRLNPMGRNEGPVHFCVHPGLLQPAVLGTFADGSIDEAHVINVYVHLLEAPKRRTSIMKKLKADERAKQEAALQPKKPKYIWETNASRRPVPPFWCCWGWIPGVTARRGTNSVAAFTIFTSTPIAAILKRLIKCVREVLKS